MDSASSTSSAPVPAAIAKPSRPLSAYNLFYRYKRTKLIEAGSNPPRDVLYQVLSTTTGLENYPPAALHGIPPDILDGIRRSNIRAALRRQLLSRDTTNRRHRRTSKSGFKLGFVEMNRQMVNAWKAADDFARACFQELADEGRRMVKLKMVDATHRPAGLVEHHVVEAVASSPISIPPASHFLAPVPFAREGGRPTNAIRALGARMGSPPGSPGRSPGPVKTVACWEPLPFNDVTKSLPSSRGGSPGASPRASPVAAAATIEAVEFELDQFPSPKQLHRASSLPVPMPKLHEAPQSPVSTKPQVLHVATSPIHSALVTPPSGAKQTLVFPPAALVTFATHFAVPHAPTLEAKGEDAKDGLSSSEHELATAVGHFLIPTPPHTPEPV